MVFSECSYYISLYPDIAFTIATYRIIWLDLSANRFTAHCQLYICPALFFSRRKLTPVCKQFDFFTLFFGFLYKSKGVELFLEFLSSATGSSRSRPCYLLIVWVVWVTVIVLAKVPTSLVKHKCVKEEASTLFLKIIYRIIFLTPSTTWSFSVVHKCTFSNSFHLPPAAVVLITPQVPLSLWLFE